MNEDWWDPSSEIDPSDPAAIERERRRREREARRRERAAQSTEAKKTPRKSRDFGVRTPRRQGGTERRAPRAKVPRSGGRPGGLRWFAAAAIALVAIAAAWFLISLFQPFHGEGGERVNLQVPEGASVGEIGSLLEDRGVIADSRFFQLRVTLAGKRSEMYPGSYTLQKDMSYSRAIEALSTMPVERTLTITIPEGFSRRQIAAIVSEAGLPGDYMKATVRSKRLNPADYGGRKAKNLEGFLFPATYELPADSGVKALVNNQLKAFKDRLSGISMKKARAKNLTVYDVLTIASMIEREVSVPEERRLVASVIYNRLKQGIPLGIDATTRFAVNNYTEPLTKSQLASDSPYNTRVHAGLPPGPIGNPGEDSIRAAANPAKTDYLYYVVKPGTCGEHAFSSGYAQFEKDVAAYNAAREAAGGKSPVDCP
jgi:UPF0755 protein